MLKFRCRACEQKIGVPEEWAGRVVRCPRCREGVRVPRLIDVPVVPPLPELNMPAAPTGPVKAKAPLTPIPPPKAAPAPKAAGPAVPKTPNVAAPSPAPMQMNPVARGPEASPAAPQQPVEIPPGTAPVPAHAARIVTQRPTGDFSSLFAGSGVQGVGPADVRQESGAADEPVARHAARPQEPARDAGDSGGALSSMIDVFGGPEESGTTSHAAVSDMVRGLTRPAEEDRTGVAARAARPPAIGRPTSERAGAGEVARHQWARWMGPLAMLSGAGALALCVIPHLAKFAVPAGAAGLVIAIAGAVVPAGRRGAEVAMAVGGSAVSVIGIVLAILLASDVVPAAGARAAAVARKNLPVARAGDVEVRVASVGVVRPVMCDGGGWKSARSDGAPLLQVTLEIRDVGPSGGVEYRTWGAIRPESEPVILTDNEGNQLKLIDPSPKTPAGRPRAFPAPLRARGSGVADVLLFDVPPSAVRELDLRLPAANCQMRGAFELHIPAGMLRR